MKDLRVALREFLLSDPEIAEVVADRVYPLVLPQGTVLASVVYARVSGAGDYSMQGPTGYVSARLQIDAWAPSANGASNLSNLIKARIDGYRGVIGSGANAVQVHGVFVADQREDYDDTVQLHRNSRDYFVHHIEL